jgi:hypothetical protein
MREPKIKPSDLQTEVKRLVDSGRMPSLAEVLAAVDEIRERYKDRILAARELASDPSQATEREYK